MLPVFSHRVIQQTCSACWVPKPNAHSLQFFHAQLLWWISPVVRKMEAVWKRSLATQKNEAVAAVAQDPLVRCATYVPVLWHVPSWRGKKPTDRDGPWQWRVSGLGFHPFFSRDLDPFRLVWQDGKLANNWFYNPEVELLVAFLWSGGQIEKLHQHRPQTATSHVSTMFMCNKEVIGGRIPEKRNERTGGDKARNRTRNKNEPENHDGTQSSSWERKEK